MIKPRFIDVERQNSNWTTPIRHVPIWIRAVHGLLAQYYGWKVIGIVYLFLLPSLGAGFLYQEDVFNLVVAWNVLGFACAFPLFFVGFWLRGRTALAMSVAWNLCIIGWLYTSNGRSPGPLLLLLPLLFLLLVELAIPRTDANPTYQQLHFLSLFFIVAGILEAGQILMLPPRSDIASLAHPDFASLVHFAVPAFAQAVACLGLSWHSSNMAPSCQNAAVN